MIKLFTHMKYLFVKDNTTNTVANVIKVIRSRTASVVGPSMQPRSGLS